MNTYRILTGGLVLIAALLAGSVSAEAQNSRTLEVLQTNPDVRTTALGETMGARQDRMSLFVSPLALIPQEGNFGIEASTQIYPKVEEITGRTMQYNVIGGFKFLDRHAISVGFRYQNAPEIQWFDLNDFNASADPYTVKPFDWSLDLAYGFQITPEFSMSVSGNVIASWLGYGSYTGAASIGAFYNREYTFSDGQTGVLGLALKVNDIGAPLNYGPGHAYALPTNFAFSVEFGRGFAPNHHFNFLLGAKYYFLPPEAQLFTLGGGVEYDYNDLIFARLGLQYGTRDTSRFTAGLGVKFLHRFALDAAYSNGMDRLSGVDVWSVGLTTRF